MSDDDQPTASFSRIPYPSGKGPDGPHGATPEPDAPPLEPAGEAAADAESAAVLDVPEALASSSRGLRRQRRRLLQRREELLFHLGGLAYELHLLGELRPEVAQRRAGMVHEIDTTLQAIDAQLVKSGDPSGTSGRLPIVVGSCRTCHTLFVADARYCMKCGAPLAPPEAAFHAPNAHPTKD